MLQRINGSRDASSSDTGSYKSRTEHMVAQYGSSNSSSSAGNPDTNDSDSNTIVTEK